ncbi:hypothetical protein DL96DRAFT_1821727 [Flagelloscypha sp. PMI_526]|nr:hypothetical protein DL96DRAFT_1821727 [Flagelloscypha sp. PMI_526]
MIPSLVFSLILLPCLIWGKAQYYVDDTNTTNWSIFGYNPKGGEPSLYNESYSSCGWATCTGFFTFQGSSVELFGVSTGGDGCGIEFSWPSKTQSFHTDPLGSLLFNVSLVKADGFDLNELSTVNFKEVTNAGCNIGLDYALITVDDAMISNTNHAVGTVSSASKSRVGSIVGGVAGGVIIALSLLAWRIWIMRRRRKEIRGHTEPKSVLVETEPLTITSIPPNSLAISAREKQIFDEESNAVQGASSSTFEPNTANSSLKRSKTEDRLSLIPNPEVHPDVQARLEQLEVVVFISSPQHKRELVNGCTIYGFTATVMMRGSEIVEIHGLVDMAVRSGVDGLTFQLGVFVDVGHLNKTLEPLLVRNSEIVENGKLVGVTVRSEIESLP